MAPNPPGPLVPHFLTELPALYEFANVLSSNALFMQAELENLPDLAEVKVRIANLCEELIGLAYDFRKEAANLECKLTRSPGDASWDADISNPDPFVTLTLMQAMPNEVLLELFLPLVKALETDEATLDKHPSSYILVLESGSNMLKSHAQAMGAIKQIESLLQEKASSP